ncbi:Histone acetyltransferase type b catalytic subunit [Handroanthus impetiginosus]|uniref:histone acetyltransferase n=1 Tax=Handroanthus impetiginosus TaxID=429701 RepID=A0A2G9HB18_9LAMI|nr:Histone acetyltransferase type b catalytic subunit [Handroanthus impetiginosus]
MGTKHQSSSDPISESKRRRRAGFSKIDAGIEANECIKIYLVSSEDEVYSPHSFQIEPVDLNHFFEEDGKIYGYQGLKITVWLSSISFHAYADISFGSSSDGGKGITDLKSSLQNIFAENLVEGKDEFLHTFSTECHYVKSIVSSAELLPKNASNGCSGNSNSHLEKELVDLEVFRVSGPAVGQLYCRLVPLVLLLIDGSNPIDVIDPRWEIYILVQNSQQDSSMRLLGFAAVYRYHRYPNSVRLRLGQILIMPPYQRKGYGSRLLKVLNSIAIADDVYDLTVEEPVDSLQHVRTCIDMQRLLAFDPIQQALNPVISQLKHENLSKKSQPCQCSPPANIVEDVRKNLKINKRQFLQCWEILIYLSLDPIEKYMENYKTIISNRVKADVIGKESEGAGKRLVDIPTEFDQDMSFAMFKSRNGDSTNIEKDENVGNQEEQLRQLVDERMKEIKLVAEKILANRS